MQAKNRHVESGRGRGKGPSPLFFSKQTCYIKLNFEGTGYLPYFNGIMSEIAWLVNINLLCFSRFSPHSYHHFQKRCNVHEERAKKYANTGLFLPIVLMRKEIKGILLGECKYLNKKFTFWTIYSPYQHIYAARII